MGQPVQPDANRVVVRGAADPHDLLAPPGKPTDAGDPVIEVWTDTMVVEAGETPRITTRVRRADGRPVTNATVVVDDADPPDDPPGYTRPPQGSHKATHRGNGEYVAELDATPGEHTVVVNADAVVDGTSIHRGIGYSYEVATGRVRVTGLGPTRQDATTLHIPLELACTEKGFFQFEGVLVSNGIMVARAQSTAWVMPGDERGVELRFNLGDLVERGPYALSDVTVIQYGAHGVAGSQIATSPAQVGNQIAVGPHAIFSPRPTPDESAYDPILNPQPRGLRPLAPHPVEGP